MKIGIFAADEIGQKIVSLFSKRNQEIMFLVLDEKESGHINEQIKNTARCKNIYFNKDLYWVKRSKTHQKLTLIHYIQLKNY